ncbi:FkbM family methyltransferase [Flavivirga spongiicola]|uniref:FkbM family methyltransferase n=1 Tax=Flavivirga spongiicola TaxID=421621 RepID=A0ABU7XPT4_9FLAO|nr:FkbM family methyltransferase [Flavivirga sp. MEBiC05379]MDO5977546.1 FkbM family methyltransferase [Flavivirga sp. MEBiC05379]
MRFTNKVLSVLSDITRKLPYHRKLNQIYKHLNRLLLALGAKPIVKAKMKDDTTILVDLSTKTERISFYTGQYDPDLISIIHSLFNPNTCFLDIGGNIGYYSVSIGNFIRSKKASGKVVAFEPFEGNYLRLINNLKENNLGEICEANQFGLSNKSEKTEITLREDFKHGSNTGNAAIRTSEAMDEGFKVSPIKLERLDDVWCKDYSHYGNIDLIKMDIEGHEDFCLEGGKETINKHRPTILMEVNKPYYEAREVELDELFFPLIPKNYNIYKESGTKWSRIESLNDCSRLDNVFLIPVEKLELEAYHIFKN